MPKKEINEECLSNVSTGVHYVADGIRDAIRELGKDPTKGDELRDRLFALETEINDYIEKK